MANDTDRLARRYGRSLLEDVAAERGEKVMDRFQEELSDLAFLAEGEMGAFFSNPVFDRTEKRAVLEGVLASHTIDAELKAFLELLIEMGHMALLPQILSRYGEAVRERRNEIHARVRSAFVLSKDEQARLAEGLGKVSGKTVFLDVTVDKDLIGGVVAEVGGVVYDASIRSYLERIQKECRTWR